MSDPVTCRYELPLLQAAQAQKHVTVNEALLRLDALANLVLQGLNCTQPPETVVDGQCFALGGAPVNEWAGHGGQIAIGSNGGWIFVTPPEGQRAFDLASGKPVIFRGTAWAAGAVTLTAFGSALVTGCAEEEVELGIGASQQTTIVIPAGVMVIGAAARVSRTIAGAAQSWSLGTAGALDRFGSGLGLGAGAYARGILGSPMTYWEPAPLVITGTGGGFTGGAIRVAVHWLALRLPD